MKNLKGMKYYKYFYIRSSEAFGIGPVHWNRDVYVKSSSGWSHLPYIKKERNVNCSFYEWFPPKSNHWPEAMIIKIPHKIDRLFNSRDEVTREMGLRLIKNIIKYEKKKRGKT